MAIKKYNISQVVTLNNSVLNSFFQVRLEAADLPKLTGLLEGGYKITEVNDSLSDMTKADTNVTAVNAARSIGMIGKDADGDPLFNTIKPFKGSIYLKDTVDSNAVQAALSTTTPFKNSTEKPKSINVSLSERVPTASE